MRNVLFHFIFAMVSAVMLAVFSPPSVAEAAVIRTPSPDGTVTYGSGKVVVDASHTADGYVMIRYSGGAGRVKVRITKGIQYTYNLNTSGAYETFPLTEGNGTYTVSVFEQVQGTS